MTDILMSEDGIVIIYLNGADGGDGAKLMNLSPSAMRLWKAEPHNLDDAILLGDGWLLLSEI